MKIIHIRDRQDVSSVLQIGCLEAGGIEGEDSVFLQVVRLDARGDEESGESKIDNVDGGCHHDCDEHAGGRSAIIVPHDE